MYETQLEGHIFATLLVQLCEEKQIDSVSLKKKKTCLSVPLNTALIRRDMKIIKNIYNFNLTCINNTMDKLACF